MKQQRIVRRYSVAFKQKVVSEIEAGTLTIAHAQKLYDIRGRGSIYYWLRHMGKAHLLNHIVRIQMADETSKLKQLEKEKQRLESALAQAHLKILTLEATLEVLEEQAGVSAKKKTDAGLSKLPSDVKLEGSNGSR